MKKIILSTVLSLFVYTFGFAQKELWGVSTGHGYINPQFPSDYGNIFKVGLDGQNKTIIHAFDSINGMLPMGRLLLASNGKLYGTASQGGVAFPPPHEHNSFGLMYEYDITFDEFKVVAPFGSSALPGFSQPIDGVIESTPGKLFGTTLGRIFKYDIDAEAASFTANVPSFMSQLLLIDNSMEGELTMASNGMLYGTTKHYSACPGGAPFLGSIARINPTTNAFTYIYPFNCSPVDGGWHPTGSMVEGTPGKLYGTTTAGGNYGYENQGIGNGILFEYSIATNTFAKKFDFDAAVTGAYSGPLLNGGNGKLYGLLFGNNTQGSPVYYGALYQYDTGTSVFSILKQFGSESPHVVHPRDHLVKGSDGNLYGVCQSGIFKYDFSTAEATVITLNTASDEIRGIIEICRKPSYPFFETAVFTVCPNNPFVFDVQNTNAISYVWKKGSTILAAQTTGVLNIANLTIADTGIYTCTMTNECGTTITMPLQITVNSCLGLDEVIGYKNAIKLFPNPAANILNLKLPDAPNFEIQKISISNMLGQTVYSSADKNTTIDIGFLKTGIYQLSLSTDQGDWNGKFIKQ